MFIMLLYFIHLLDDINLDSFKWKAYRLLRISFYICIFYDGSFIIRMIPFHDRNIKVLPLYPPVSITRGARLNERTPSHSRPKREKENLKSEHSHSKSMPRPHRPPADWVSQSERVYSRTAVGNAEYSRERPIVREQQKVLGLVWFSVGSRPIDAAPVAARSAAQAHTTLFWYSSKSKLRTTQTNANILGTCVWWILKWNCQRNGAHDFSVFSILSDNQWLWSNEWYAIDKGN